MIEVWSQAVTDNRQILLLDLTRFRGDADHLERRFDPSVFSEQDADVRVGAPVDFVADVQKDKKKVRLVGRLTTTLTLECSRCLEPFAAPVDARFDLLFLPAALNAGDGEQEVNDDDLGVSYYQADVIDLAQVVREQFYLTLPMKPLCQEDCRGLCSVCGINRNCETCSCRSEWVDPRLAALKNLNLKL